MNNARNRIFDRFLAILLSVLMILSVPCINSLIALAAMSEHPGAVTIKVKDDAGSVVKNATVVYTIDSLLQGDAYKTGTATTDETGVVEVLVANDFVADDLTISATVTAAGHESNTIADMTITSATQNIDVEIVSRIIKNVNISWNETLVYSGQAQSLVSVTKIAGDTIEYLIDEVVAVKPEKTNAGTYNVKVTVKRTGKDDLVESRNITIAPKLLEGISLSPYTNLVYNNAEQSLLSVPNGIQNGDLVTWIVGMNAPETYIVDSSNITYVPKATNADEYQVRLTVERNGGNYAYDSGDLTATISKAPQSLAFVNTNPTEVTIDRNNSANNVYDFKAQGDNLSGNEVEYSLIDANPIDAANLTSAGILTVAKAGIVTVKAYRDGNANYEPAEVYSTVVVKTDDESLVQFAVDNVNYVLSANTTVSTTVATKTHSSEDNGVLTYKINKNNIGLSIDANTGKLTINNYGKLIAAMGSMGSTSVVVTVSKSVGTVTSEEWYFNHIFDWGTREITKEVYPTATDSYTVQISFETAPEFDEVCTIENPDSSSGWYNNAYPAIVTPRDTEKYLISVDGMDFNSSVTVTKQGENTQSIILKDKTNNKYIRIPLSIKVDTVNPIISTEYSETNQNIKITVVEKNFRPADVTVVTDARNNKDESVEVGDLQAYIQNPANWLSSNDTNTIVLESAGTKKVLDSANYQLTIDCKDIALNSAEQKILEDALIDREAPKNIAIEFNESEVDTVLEGLKYGFYQSAVNVTITAYDENSGVASFVCKYKKQDSASTINHPDTITKNIYAESQMNDSTVAFEQDVNDPSRFVATFTLTATEFEQFRGSFSVITTDCFGNSTETINDDIIVVDNVAPNLISVEYSPADKIVGDNSYYNRDIKVTFKITEANFYEDDVIISVTKDGAPFNYGAVEWTEKDTNDVSIGTLTLLAPATHAGDGDYEITVAYEDKSTNEMTQYMSDILTIDTTKPEISIAYDDANVRVLNELPDRYGKSRKYYGGSKKATVNIVERNFNKEIVEAVFTIKAEDVSGNAISADALREYVLNASNWTHNGNTHSITINYTTDANYSFDIAYTDMATNEANDYGGDYFTVDKTAPTNLKVEYSTSILDTVLESSAYGFYNAKVTVTLTAEDSISGVHSFHYSYLKAAGVSPVNVELIKEEIREANIKYSSDKKTATATFEIPRMALENHNQFNGIVEFATTDRAANESANHRETKRIIVDNIVPTATVEYNEAANVEGDVSYYDGDINATITITEANFYANDVQVTVIKDGGAATAVTPTWKTVNTDVHVGTITLQEDGDYFITVNYKDKSSNTMETYTSKQMIIDTKIDAPLYTINGVEKIDEGGAYKGNATIDFSFSDRNFDTKTITLTRTRFDKVEDVTALFVSVDDTDKGGSGSFSIPAEMDCDGIYVLKIEMVDKAKHVAEAQMMFTINRYGSVYEYSDELVNLIREGGQYVTSVTEDLVITEYNADRILADSLKILVTRDGETVDIDFLSNPENINAQVGISKDGWYKYVYTIKASNFEKDGLYKISLTSKYAASDSAENDSTSVPENSFDGQGKKIIDAMNFTVDTVAPEIRNIVNLDKAIADMDKIVDGKLNVKYTIVDVGGLKSVEVIVNGQTVQLLTAKDIADNLYNFTGEFGIEEQTGTSAMRVQIKVTDLAGNITDTDSDEFRQAHSENNENSTYLFCNAVTVSRNILVRWYANAALFWGTIGGTVAVAGAVGGLVAYRRRKKIV